MWLKQQNYRIKRETLKNNNKMKINNRTDFKIIRFKN
jgi:hypothetical protein